MAEQQYAHAYSSLEQAALKLISWGIIPIDEIDITHDEATTIADEWWNDTFVPWVFSCLPLEFQEIDSQLRDYLEQLKPSMPLNLVRNMRTLEFKATGKPRIVGASLPEGWSIKKLPECSECGREPTPIAHSTGEGWLLGYECGCGDQEIWGEIPWPFQPWEAVNGAFLKTLGFVIV